MRMKKKIIIIASIVAVLCAAGAAQPNISKEKIIATIMPLPPLAGQKRIVERLNALMQNINVVGDLIASE